MRNNRRPQVYDLNVNIITEDDVACLAEEFKFNVTFDLLGKLRIFVVKLVDEIEEARQSPSKAEMKKDLKRLEHLFNQQL